MIRALIVDDEPRGAEALEILLKKVSPDVEVLAVAYNVLDGIKKTQALHPDVIFLDIHMPVNSGFDLLEHIERENVLVVFTTAYEEHSIKALRKKAFDYLLKPIDPEELKACIDRVRAATETLKQNGTATKKQPSASKKLCIPVKEGTLFISPSEIIRIEGSGSYSSIFMTGGEKHFVSKSLKELEEQLDKSIFFRCHNSHIVNLTKAKKYIKTDGNFVQMEDGSMAEISRNRKEEFLALIS